MVKTGRCLGGFMPLCRDVVAWGLYSYRETIRILLLQLSLLCVFSSIFSFAGSIC